MQAVGEVVHPLDLLVEAVLVVLPVLEKEEWEMVPLAIPLGGEVAQA